MSTPWSAWLPDVLPHVKQCPVAIAEHEIKRAAQDLLQTSRAWSVLTAAQAVTAGQSTVTVDLVDPSIDLVRLETVWFDGVKLTPATPGELDVDEGSSWISKTGQPSRFIQLTPGFLRLYPAPAADATTGVTARCTVMPSEAADGLPDELANRYWDEIWTGARGKLMIYKDRPWSDPNIGAAYLGQFSSQKSAVLVSATLRGLGNARPRTRPRWC